MIFDDPSEMPTDWVLYNLMKLATYLSDYFCHKKKNLM